MNNILVLSYKLNLAHVVFQCKNKYKYLLLNMSITLNTWKDIVVLLLCNRIIKYNHVHLDICIMNPHETDWFDITF